MPQFFIDMLETHRANRYTLKIDYYMVKYLAKKAKAQSESSNLTHLLCAKVVYIATHAQLLG